MKLPEFFSTALGCAAVAASALAFTASASAQTDPHAGMAHSANMQGSATASPSPSTQAFQQGGEKMMQGMSQPYTGDADQDFVAQMLAHHQGAVSMAQVELKYGKDAELKKLARDIIKAQQQEIAFMKKWQARHAPKSGMK